MAYTPVILATGGYDHKIRFWEATTGACTKTLSFGESQLNCLSISPDKSLLAAGGNSQLQLFDIKGSSSDGKPLISYEGHSGNVTAVGFQRDLKWLYTGSEDGTVRVWDPRSGTSSTRTYECGSSVNTVALNPNQAELITGDQNGNVKIWDLSADRCREEYVPAQDVPVRSISISFDASLVAVGSHKGKVFMYQTTSEKVCLHPCSHKGRKRGRKYTHNPPTPYTHTAKPRQTTETRNCWGLSGAHRLPAKVRHLTRHKRRGHNLGRQDDQTLVDEWQVGNHPRTAPAVGVGRSFLRRLALPRLGQLRLLCTPLGLAHRRGHSPL